MEGGEREAREGGRRGWRVERGTEERVEGRKKKGINDGRVSCAYIAWNFNILLNHPLPPTLLPPPHLCNRWPTAVSSFSSRVAPWE